MSQRGCISAQTTPARDAQRYDTTRPVDQVRALSDQIVAREPLGSAGASGNTLERVSLRDGRELIRKEVSAQWDWISRATRDDGRVVKMCERGLFERFPSTIDHATVAAEHAADRWSVFMRDISARLVSADRRLGRAEVRRVLEALADLHVAFWGERFDDLCGLEDRYNLLSPSTGRRERERGERVGELITRCWEHFAELVPGAIAKAIVTLAEQPSLLAEQLDTCEPTLIHGDVRLSNLGFADDRVVLVDWGERTGSAPAPVELASFLVFDAKRLDVSRDDVVADFRSLYGDRFDEKAMELALIGGFVQLGCPLHPADRPGRRTPSASRSPRRTRVVDTKGRRGAGEVVAGMTERRAAHSSRVSADRRPTLAQGVPCDGSPSTTGRKEDDHQRWL